VDLSVPSTGHANHPRPNERPTRTDPKYCVESPGSAVGAIQKAGRHRQSRAQGYRRDRPGVGRLHMGHCSHGRTEVCLNFGWSSICRKGDKPQTQNRLRHSLVAAGWGGWGTLEAGYEQAQCRCTFTRQRKPRDEPWSCGNQPADKSRINRRPCFLPPPMGVDTR